MSGLGAGGSMAFSVQYCAITLGFGEGTNSLLLRHWCRAGGTYLRVLIKQLGEVYSKRGPKFSFLGFWCTVLYLSCGLCCRDHVGQPTDAVFQISCLSPEAPCCSQQRPSGELSEVSCASRRAFLLSLPRACGDVLQCLSLSIDFFVN